MNKARLEQIAAQMVENGRGILASDESTGTIAKRLASINVENNEENRIAYRDLLFTTKGLGEYVSGAILYDETIRQNAACGTKKMTDLLNAQNILSGIKVDKGAKALPNFTGETITEGLDGLGERFAEYASLGATFSKWRAVIDIAQDIPSYYALKANAEALARYAALSQNAGIVPIVEPEVLMDGDHSIERCYEVTSKTLQIVFNALYDAKIHLEGIILKPNMVISGMKNGNRASAEQVAEQTVKCLKAHVPASVGGIAFLSGGQGDVEATKHLHLMNQGRTLPWALTFSYGRALQAACLKAWGGKKENIETAQNVLLHRARMNALAALGQWSETEENGQTKLRAVS